LSILCQEELEASSPNLIKMNATKNMKLPGILLTVLLFFFVLTGLFGLNNYLGLSPEPKFWLSRFELWAVLLLIYMFARKVEKDNFLLWPEKKNKPLFYVLSLLVIVIVITVLLTSLSLVLKKVGMASNDKALTTMTDLLCSNLALLVFTCVTAAITEELIFRGYLLPRIDSLVKNKWLSIFISALLFGLVHIGYADFGRMLMPFLIGLVFGIYYYRYRSLAVLIICHFIMDFYSIYGACK